MFAFLQWVMDVEDLQGVEEHVASGCRIAPTDPDERRMFELALFLQLNAKSREEALEQLLEVRRNVGAPVSEARLKEIVNAAYDHPDKPGVCRGQPPGRPARFDGRSETGDGSE
jgi:hypothetical protein